MINARNNMWKTLLAACPISICLMNRPFCSEWQNDQLKVLSFPVASETRGGPRRHFWPE